MPLPALARAEKETQRPARKTGREGGGKRSLELAPDKNEKKVI